jgi:glycogen debranching enzyme
VTDLVVLDGSSFFVSDPRGDSDGSEATGFFHSDVRHLAAWRLLVDGEPVRLLSSRTVDYYSARVFGTLADAAVGRNPAISVQRDRIVSDGIHEDIAVENHSGEARQVLVELRFGSDFADLFEVKDGIDKRPKVRCEVRDREITLTYRRDRFERATHLRFDREGFLEPGRARFEVALGPRERWELCIDVYCTVDGEERGPRAGHGGFGQLEPQMPMTLEEWLEAAPVVDTDFDPLRHAYRQSLVDLAALRFRPFPHLDWSLPAAGLPWFMALFGRDSLIAAYQALPFQPHLATATLEALAGCQPEDYDDVRDAEPGKMLHELRRGELTVLGERPHSPYYGAHDTTPLFLVLLDEYERWTGDTELVRRLEPAARRALAWIDGPGDPDGDGYLEYKTRSPRGLRNHCWKDSYNSILFADGRVAEPPIATCEIQAYAYDARLRTARLAREICGDRDLAERLVSQAHDLKQRFQRDFWDDKRGGYVLALDRDKHQVDAMTSNVGHLLWSGIADETRLAPVVERLMAEDMFSGWGIRTMSASDAGYNPIEYHNGTVWPHDTSIVAEGLRRSGAHGEAARLVTGLFEAAEHFGYRLPEVFAGFPRSATHIPVEYPTPSRPQAWAAGSVLLGIRTLLGMDPDGARLRSAPRLPPTVDRLMLEGVPFRGTRVNVP